MSDRPHNTTPGLAEVRQDAAMAAEQVKAEASRVASTATAHAQDLAQEAMASGQQILGVATQRAESAFEQGKEMGAEQAQGLARAVHRAADDLQQTSPEIARHVHSAAGAIEGIADALRNRSAGELFDEVQGFARRQPAAFFGAAALVGFALARFAKASATGHSYRHHSDSSAHLYGAEEGGTFRHAHDDGASPRMVPGWTPDAEGAPARPATMAGASLGGAAAYHARGGSAPGTMPTAETTTAMPVVNTERTSL